MKRFLLRSFAPFNFILPQADMYSVGFTAHSRADYLNASEAQALYYRLPFTAGMATAMLFAGR